MTIDQFLQKLAKPEKVDDILNYLVCISFIGMGLWIVHDLVENDFFHPEMGNGKFIILFFPFGFIFIGVYGIWRISKDNKVGCIPSNKTLDEKWEIVNDYLSQLKIKSKKVDNNHIECIYDNNFVNRLVMNIYLDDEKILFNIRSFDSTINKGFIDFGFSTRATGRLKKYLKDRL